MSAGTQSSTIAQNRRMSRRGSKMDLGEQNTKEGLGLARLMDFCRNDRDNTKKLKEIPDRHECLTKLTEYGWGLMHIAGSYGNTDALEILLNKRANPNEITYDGQSPLTCAARAGKLEAVQKLLPLTNFLQKTKYSALIWAAMYGNLEIVKLLSEKESEVNRVDESGRTAIIWAALHGHMDVVQYLVEQRADVRSIAIAKHIATERNETMNFLVELLHRNEMLLEGARYRDLEIVKEALDLKAQVDAKDDDNWTALMWSAINGDFDILVYLVSEGANVNVRDENGKTAQDLVRAKEPIGGNQWTEIARYLDEVTTVSYLTPEAAKNNDLPNVKKGLTHKVTVGFTDPVDWQPLHWAAFHGNIEMAEELLNLKAQIELSDACGNTPLIIAAAAGRLDIIKYFKETFNVDFKRSNSNSETQMDMASKYNHTDTLQWCLDERRQSLELQWLDMWAPKGEFFNEASKLLIQGAEHGSIQVIRLLGELKMDLNIKRDFDGTKDNTALIVAARRGKHAVSEYLIDKSPSNVNAVDSTGRSAMSYCAENGYSNLVEQLCDLQADIKLADTQGWTSLHYAASKGYTDICQTLLLHGACVHSKTTDGNTPVYFARRNGHSSTEYLLLSENALAQKARWSKGLNLLKQFKTAGKLQSLMRPGPIKSTLTVEVPNVEDKKISRKNGDNLKKKSSENDGGGRTSSKTPASVATPSNKKRLEEAKKNGTPSAKKLPAAKAK